MVLRIIVACLLLLASQGVALADGSSAAVPVGSASGDLCGTYPAPTVCGIRGVSINATVPNNSVLSVNGSGAGAFTTSLTLSPTELSAATLTSTWTNNADTAQNAMLITNQINESNGAHVETIKAFAQDQNGTSGNHILVIEARLDLANAPSAYSNGIYGYVAGITPCASGCSGVFPGPAYRAEANYASGGMWKQAYYALDGCCGPPGPSGGSIGVVNYGAAFEAGAQTAINAAAPVNITAGSQSVTFDSYNNSQTLTQSWIYQNSAGSILLVGGSGATNSLGIGPSGNVVVSAGYAGLTLDDTTGGSIAFSVSGTLKARILVDTSAKINSVVGPLEFQSGGSNIGDYGVTTSAVWTWPAMMNFTGAIESNGTAGKSETCTIVATETLIFTNGLLTGGTCGS